ncbi:MAG: transporter substrate-binding domain-containing protein [Methylophaga sp.]|nr:transporter substrate-binding domain-containing protein [Methylophaga sp.]
MGYVIESHYAFKDRQQVTDESPESARQIADLVGIKAIQWVELPFSQLIPPLTKPTNRMIATGLFINRQRQRQVRFSLPTLKVYPSLLALADKVPQINSNLQKNIDADLQFVVVHGSVEAAKLTQLKQPVK